MMSFKKLLCICLILILTTGLLVGCGEPKENTQTTDDSQNTKDLNQEIKAEKIELLVSAAASLTDVLNELGHIYEKENSNIKVNFTYGSSGALQSQIEEGAPVDIFLSAAEKQMDALEEGGHIVKDTRKTLLINKVVLITPSNNDLQINDFEDLKKDEIKKVAIGDPSNVPVGQYSEEIFTNLKLKDSIKEKLIYANDVRTVLTWVENEEVDCGLVYATDAFTTNKVKIIDEAPKGSHKDVSYPVAAIGSSKNLDASQAFIEFLSNEEAAEVFKKYGFQLN